MHAPAASHKPPPDVRRHGLGGVRTLTRPTCFFGRALVQIVCRGSFTTDACWRCQGSSDHELTCAADGPWPPSFLTFEWHGWGIGTAKRRGLGHSCRSHTLRSTGRFSPKPDTKGLATLAEQQLLNQYRSNTCRLGRVQRRNRPGTGSSIPALHQQSEDRDGLVRRCGPAPLIIR